MPFGNTGLGKNDIGIKSALQVEGVDEDHELQFIVAGRILFPQALDPVLRGRSRNDGVPCSQNKSLNRVMMASEWTVFYIHPFQEGVGIISHHIIPGGGVFAPEIIHVEIFHCSFELFPADHPLNFVVLELLPCGRSALVRFHQFGIDRTSGGFKVSGDDVQSGSQDGAAVAVIMMSRGLHAPNQGCRLGDAEEMGKLFDLGFGEDRFDPRPSSGRNRASH